MQKYGHQREDSLLTQSTGEETLLLQSCTLLYVSALSGITCHCGFVSTCRGIATVASFIFAKSTSLEVRHAEPTHSIPSQRWAPASFPGVNGKTN